VQHSTQSLQQIQHRSRFGRNHRLHQQFAFGIEHGHADRALVDIQANVLHTLHGRSFRSVQLLLLTATAAYSERGALLYCVAQALNLDVMIDLVGAPSFAFFAKGGNHECL
jgi:hypothetical protein